MLEVGTGFNGELTGRENIYLNGAILGMTKAEVDSKMEDIIEFSECRQFIDTPVKRYSSGMYVKLAFSVAAHLDSEILIMDEVLAVGDMAFQKKCLDKMSQVSKDEGRTILYVSHNMNTIRQLCDRCIVLNHGRIVFNGEVEEAIEVYMDHYFKDIGVDIDLSKSRLKHLPSKVDCKMLRLVLVDKQQPTYEFNEDIKFNLDIEAFRNIHNLCARLEICAADDTPIGIAYDHDLGSINGRKKFSLSLKNPCLIQGKYRTLLVIYEVDKFGNYCDLDAVLPAFSFAVVDNKNKIGINWNPRVWGRVFFGDLK